MSVNAPALLTVERLAIAFAGAGPSTPVLRGVDFALARGGSLALVGESGSGKSVTALALLGLLPPSARVTGRVLLDGVDLQALDEPRRRRYRGRGLGLVPQDPSASLDPVFTIGAQLAETLRWHFGLSRRAARERAVALLEEVQLPDAARRADEYPHRLSGGMRQRALLALALAGEPDVLIADEPTTALDVTAQARILGLLGELSRRRGMALLLITHDLALVPGLAQRVAVMYGGLIMEEGPADMLLAAPAHPYTRALVASLPESWPPAGPLPELPGDPHDPRRPEPGCPFAPRCCHARPACRAAVPAPLAVGPGRRAACLPDVTRALAAGREPS